MTSPRAAYNRIWHLNNQARVRARKMRLYREKFPLDGKVRNRAERKAIVNKLKNKPCTDCGGWFNPWVMDFDHRDPSQKVSSISQMLTGAIPMAMIYAEVEKCDLVCSNCHRDRTHKRKRVFYRSPKTQELLAAF